MKKPIILAIANLLFLTNVVLANQTQQQLTQVTKKIATVTTLIDNEQMQRNTFQHELEATELAANHLLKKITKTKKNLNQQQVLLKILQKKKQYNQLQLAHQQYIFRKQIQAAYILGREPTIKLLFNQDNINKISRLLNYYRYISNDEVKLIVELQQTLQQIKTNQQAIQQHVQLLHQLNNKLHREQLDLDKSKHQRRILIDKVNQSIRTKSQQLEQLLTNKKTLESTLQKIAAKHLRHQPTFLSHFSRWKGKLRWPTKGYIQNYFDTKINQSELRWKGILIKAPKDQAVRAIANGIVVFAKWLAGYGLLMIIDHGDGYMSLYGRNHMLYKQVGDKVQAGEKIASVGESGGYQTPALYFAIRHNAKPLDPTLWCKK